MSGKTGPQLLAEARAVLDKLREVDTDGTLMLSLFYAPSDALKKAIDEFEALCGKAPLTRPDAIRIGEVLEEVALLAFTCLNGWSDVGAFTSATAQHDLLIYGASLEWAELIKALHLTEGTGQILVEAKATADAVDNTQFLRLCALIEQMQSTVGLGVFLARSGASGFPADASQSQEKIGDARLTQALFYATTRRPVVVLDRADIRALATPGSLPIILERKIRDIAELQGRPTVTDVVRAERLPDRLQRLLDQSVPD